MDDKYYITGDTLEKWTYMKGAKKIERTSKTGYSYWFSEGPIAFPDPLDRPGRTMLTSEGSLNRSTHIIEDMGLPSGAREDLSWTITRTFGSRFTRPISRTLLAAARKSMEPKPR